MWGGGGGGGGEDLMKMLEFSMTMSLNEDLAAGWVVIKLGTQKQEMGNGEMRK